MKAIFRSPEIEIDLNIVREKPMNHRLFKLNVWILTILMAMSAMSLAENKEPLSPEEAATKSAIEKLLREKENLGETSNKDRKISLMIPIFGQTITFSFPIGFTVITEQMNGYKYLHESVLDGENGEKWTQIITVTGIKGIATNENLSLKLYAEFFVKTFKNACPTSFRGIKLGEFSVDGHEALAVLISCGVVNQTKKPPYSESTLVIMIKGKNDYYTLQWAERGNPSQSAIKLDEAKWYARFNSLGPIKLCTNVPGSKSTYTDCMAKK